jgi:hypothetical protein
MNELLIENAMNELAGCCPPTLAGSLADALTAALSRPDSLGAAVVVDIENVGIEGDGPCRSFPSVAGVGLYR